MVVDLCSITLDAEVGWGFEERERHMWEGKRTCTAAEMEWKKYAVQKEAGSYDVWQETEGWDHGLGPAQFVGLGETWCYRLRDCPPCPVRSSDLRR